MLVRDTAGINFCWHGSTVILHGVNYFGKDILCCLPHLSLLTLTWADVRVAPDLWGANRLTLRRQRVPDQVST